ncbi:MAG: hypothetical protein IT319_15130 [Anaerolineae bacterium]|nr:hypothetical protein [Anaerolineae bacterium]
MKRLFQILVGWLLIGCSGTLPDSPATQRAEISEIIAEATAIQVTREANEAQVIGTIEALHTQVAHRSAINQHLHATLRAVVPATTRVAAHGDAVATPQAITQGRRWFVKTGMASRVNESDGCSHTPESDFNTSTPRIYATLKAYNIESGTPLSASWTHQGQKVHEESFRLDRSAGEICLWFYIDPQTVAFTPGMWTVQLYADGFPLESVMAFNIAHDT